MLRITPSGSCGGVSVKKVVVLRVGVGGNKLEWLNSLAEGKRLLEDCGICDTANYLALALQEKVVTLLRVKRECRLVAGEHGSRRGW